MRTFKIKKPKIISIRQKPLKQLILNIDFSFKILKKNDLNKQFYIILYNVNLNKHEHENEHEHNIVYNRNNILVSFNEIEYNSKESLNIIFYSNKQYKSLKNNILSTIINKNKILYWDDNYSIKLFNIIKLSKYLSRY